MDVLIAVATIGVPIANVPMQVLPVTASLADVLAAIFSSGVVTDVTRVLPNVPTILTNVRVVAAKLPGVVMDITPVRANIVRFTMRHARVQGRVQVVDTLCADEVRTSNEQGCGNGSHSEIAHGFSQRQYRAVANMACAAYTTLARSPTLSATFDAISRRQEFPSQSFRLSARTVNDVTNEALLTSTRTTAAATRGLKSKAIERIARWKMRRRCRAIIRVDPLPFPSACV